MRGKRQGEASGRRVERLQVPLSPVPILAPSLPSFLNISGTSRTNITHSKNDFFFFYCSSLWVLLGCMQRNGVLSSEGHSYDPQAVRRGQARCLVGRDRHLLGCHRLGGLPPTLGGPLQSILL